MNPIEAFILGLVLGLGICVFIMEYLIWPVARKIVAELEAQRDAARNEAKVFRGLLIPASTRMEAAAGAAGAPPKAASATRPSAPPGVASMQPWPSRRRVGSRTYFNLVREILNTKQRTTDALASTLPAQPVPQETKQ